MSAQPNEGGELRPPPAPPGQWQPKRPGEARTPNQRKRELRKDRHRRRRIQERAEHDPTLTDFEVRVLKGYLWHSDDTAVAVYPAVATVAGKVHGHRRSVRRCVAQLEVAGYMKRFMRPLEGARNRSNLYYFCEPAGPIVEERPNQRRRSRKRSPDRGTAGTGGTPKGLEEPTPAGAAKPAPLPRQPGYRRDLPPPRQVAAQPPRFVPDSDPRSRSDHEDRESTTTACGPGGPQRRPAFGGPGVEGGGGEAGGLERPADEAREALRRATDAAKARSPFQAPRRPRRC